MKEYRCEITLPENIVSFLGLPKKELGTTLRRELAVHFFEKGCLGFGQARQLAEMSVWSFMELLKDCKVPLHYGIYEYEDDSETIERLMKQ